MDAARAPETPGQQIAQYLIVRFHKNHQQELPTFEIILAIKTKRTICNNLHEFSTGTGTIYTNALKELPTCEIALIIQLLAYLQEPPTAYHMHDLLDTQHAQHTKHSNYIIIDMDGAPFIFWQVVLQLCPPEGTTRSDTDYVA